MIKQILVKLPLVYKLRVLQLRVKRTSSNFFVNFAKERSVDQLLHVIKRHQSTSWKKKIINFIISKERTSERMRYGEESSINELGKSHIESS
ncbi:hypothetical protein EDM55_28025 [Brevibacillus centrosporus]|nr:hypothetical protein EDM55_28025 [Brevibacillus centrosporus]